MTLACDQTRVFSNMLSYPVTNILATAENTSHVMLSLVRAVGVNAPSFGAEGGYVTTGLSDIENV
jgi:hypothetical protein